MVSCQGRTAVSPSSVNQALQESQIITGWKQATRYAAHQPSSPKAETSPIPPKHRIPSTSAAR